MTIDLINKLKEEQARLQAECIAIEKLIVIGSNLPPPRTGPPSALEMTLNGHHSPRPRRNNHARR